MGISVEEADRLSYWKFTALRHAWNEKHKPADNDPLGGEPVELPTEDAVRAAQAELYELGIAGKAPN